MGLVLQARCRDLQLDILERGPLCPECAGVLSQGEGLWGEVRARLPGVLGALLCRTWGHKGLGRRLLYLDGRRGLA